MPPVTSRVNSAGDHEVGFKVEGTFVPITTVSAAYVAQLVEREQNRAEPESESESEGGEK